MKKFRNPYNYKFSSADRTKTDPVSKTQPSMARPLEDILQRISLGQYVSGTKTPMYADTSSEEVPIDNKIGLDLTDYHEVVISIATRIEEDKKLQEMADKKAAEELAAKQAADAARLAELEAMQATPKG